MALFTFISLSYFNLTSFNLILFPDWIRLAKNLFKLYVLGKRGEKIRHKCCHHYGDDVYNPLTAASWLFMFGEIANVFLLPDLAANIMALATQYFQVFIL